MCSKKLPSHGTYSGILCEAVCQTLQSLALDQLNLDNLLRVMFLRLKVPFEQTITPV